MSREEYEEHPVTLSLAGMFYEKDIFYTYEEYSEYLRQAKEFETENKNYSLLITGGNVFRNLQITLCKGEWVMISKTDAPAIHFVIFHPRLRNAIENFVPPIIPSVDKGRHGFVAQKCAHTASSTLKIQQVFPAALSLSGHISAQQNCFAPASDGFSSDFWLLSRRLADTRQGEKDKKRRKGALAGVFALVNRW